MNKPIGTFIEEYYIPALRKYATHQNFVAILSKRVTGEKRLRAFESEPHNLKTRRDYAEQLAAKFALEIQSEHFGNGRTLSMDDILKTGEDVARLYKSCVVALSLTVPLFFIGMYVSPFDNFLLKDRSMPNSSIKSVPMIMSY